MNSVVRIVTSVSLLSVIPAKAGTQTLKNFWMRKRFISRATGPAWVPAFAGMTEMLS
jgi:hypothetical protein